MSRGFREAVTARQMRVLVMHLAKRKSFPEIARELEISANAAREIYRQVEHRLAVIDRRSAALAALASDRGGR